MGHEQRITDHADTPRTYNDLYSNIDVFRSSIYESRTVSHEQRVTDHTDTPRTTTIDIAILMYSDDLYMGHEQ